ncbi:hypothetical protein [Intrasporangium calvum]|uniref:DoxX family protein n=1 Tax=Intrasporangium calvum (strain ATCC 23552 / DSM 43043 / JCM 3097 / NBRC 12989 / NCIMB 10167 / NRRL B-3866 / 7 KIP) TaxID=710696 RepID=E6SD55_INTC7|nr:hypothetical protein [Intrasporangium calvum]ADU49673.1 hypothetical protein Intca_3189 [Intrasporangium calvum DSM 43043]
MKLSHLPLRLATGAFILNSGLGKRGLQGEAAEGLHGMASVTLPGSLKEMDATEFAQLLSRAEMALGIALLAPFVPSRMAGAALTAFGGGLLSVYLQTPGMRQEGSIRPTQAGTALAKDVWLVGAGLTLLLD